MSKHIEGMIEKHQFSVYHFICVSEENKIRAACHQYYVEKKAIALTAQASDSDGHRSVFWHR